MGRNGSRAGEGTWQLIVLSPLTLDHSGDSPNEEGGIQHMDFHFTFTRLPQAWCNSPSRNLPEINL